MPTVTIKANEVRFFAAGRPKTKGSTKFVPSVRGDGRAIPKYDPVKVAWQGVVSCAARDAGAWMASRDAGCAVLLRFYFARPKGHYGTGRNAGTLKTHAPASPTAHNLGDIDKLMRAVLDALTGIAYADDSAVVSVTASKLWTPSPESPEGVDIAIVYPQECKP